MKPLPKGSWIWMPVLLAGLSGCAGAGVRTGQYVDDSAITAKVKSEMVAHEKTAAFHISVKTVKGVVYLSGSAKSRQDADRAAEIARGVAGVKAVESDIKVK